MGNPLGSGSWASNGREFVSEHSSFSLNCSEQAGKCTATPHDLRRDTFAGKWIYLHGDSTIRQLYGSMKEHFTGIHQSFNQLKENVRESCNDRTHRKRYVPSPSFGRSNCSLNEKTCEWSNEQTRITLDWKHFVLEDREKYLFGNGGLFASMAQIDHPDVLVTKLGFHICAHTSKSF